MPIVNIMLNNSVKSVKNTPTHQLYIIYELTLYLKSQIEMTLIDNKKIK